VYALEPVAWTAELLRANAWRHGCGNVVVLPVAAGERSGTAMLAIPSEGRSGAGLTPGGDGVEVPIEPLDDLVEEPVALLKVDVEGAESAVLAGAREVIARSPGLLAVVEFRPRAADAGDVLASYERLGFELCRLRRDGRAKRATKRELIRVEDDVVNIVLRR
jgi:FkbM family methyltransferase